MERRTSLTPEEIVAKLWQAAVLTGEETTSADALRAIGVTGPTSHRWRTAFAGRLRRLRASCIGPRVAYATSRSTSGP